MRQAQGPASVSTWKRGGHWACAAPRTFKVGEESKFAVVKHGVVVADVHVQELEKRFGCGQRYDGARQEAWSVAVVQQRDKGTSVKESLHTRNDAAQLLL